ncbi:MAG: exodeoxyribonuclease VII large subunit [Clostridia bacterium]|nr:exodeoxyribonuclease VII large subunit [Clostridia bacterium]
MQEKTITVTQLTSYIKQIFEAEELLFNISVIGEVSGFKIVRGIAYFDLKDDNALISCVCFDGEKYKQTQNGDSVVAKGTPNFYAKGGRLNFNVNKIMPYGKGDLFLKFLQLKETLEKEGLFDNKHKKPVPQSVKRIGVITSQTGAVIEDIINVATRRNPAVDIVLFPAKVQGSGADIEIVKGIDFFENYNVDVIIIARGGGSMEDLNIFNSELLARRVFECKKFVVSAVGHETDFTILDFVADLRAPTPSASAELIVENVQDKKNIFLKQFARLKSSFENFGLVYKNLIDRYKTKILNNIEKQNGEYKYWLALKTSGLEKLNPNTILKMGYAKVSKENSVVISKNQLKIDDKIKIVFSDGEVGGRVE